MNELRCEAHGALAGWQCTACGKALCPDCAGYKYVPPTKLLVCALCGELAEPLLRERVEKESLSTQLPEAFLFPIRGDGPALWLGRQFWHRGDEGTIDRFGPHGAAYAVGVGNRFTTRLQSGYLYSYALVMLLGLIGAASWAIWWAR